MTKAYFIFLIILIGCLPTKQIEKEIDNNIVIVSYRFESRSDLAVAIKNINRCGPKLIGVNALFIEEQDSSDHILSKEIRAAGNVILATNINYVRIH